LYEPGITLFYRFLARIFIRLSRSSLIAYGP
jgi:hypothetical protein